MAVTFEDIVDEAGGMGRFQIMVISIVTGSKFAVAWGMLLMTFGGKIPDWWCVTETNETISQFSVNNDSTYQACAINNNTCHSYHYGGEITTVIEKFDLVCDQKQLSSLIMSIQLIGTLLLSTVAGQCADYIGRKKTLMILMLLHVIFCVVSIFSHNWQMYAFMRFMIGGAVGGVTILDTPVPVEFTGRRWRSYITGLPSWAVGAVFFALAAYILKDWRYLSIASAVVTLPFLIGMFFVPESIRWLLVHGKLDEAKRTIKRMAVINRKPCPDLSNIEEMARSVTSHTAERTYSYLDLFRTRQMAKQMILLLFLWFTFGLSYYGVTFGVVTLSGNLYVNLFLNGLVELPGTMMTTFFNNKIGRRLTIFLSLVISSLLAFAIVPVSYIESLKGTYVISVLAMSSKFASNMTWMSTKLYSSELNPTVVRSLAIAMVSIGARLGSVIAPQLIYLDQLNGSLMYLIMAIATLMSSGLIWLLPETRGNAIPDTVENVEKVHQKDVPDKQGEEMKVMVKNTDI